MKKKYLQLPKGYLSYSQKELWKHDKERYIDIYMDNRDELRTSNAGQEYGKIVATALEQGRNTDDLLTDAAMLLLPKYDIADQEIRVEMKSKYGWLPLVGRPDTLNSITKEFREYKTGKAPWTVSKAQKHPQMRFYAMLIYLAHGKVLRDAYLDWIETEHSSVDVGPQPTGRVESFRVTFTLNDLLKEMADTLNVARQIEIAFAHHVTRPEIPW